MTVVMMPVAALVAVIVTPGINAPVESETVPPNVALLVCANVRIGNTRQNSVMAANTAFLFMMHSWTRLGVTLLHRYQSKVNGGNREGQGCVKVAAWSLDIFKRTFLRDKLAKLECR